MTLLKRMKNSLDHAHLEIMKVRPSHIKGHTAKEQRRRKLLTLMHMYHVPPALPFRVYTPFLCAFSLALSA